MFLILAPYTVLVPAHVPDTVSDLVLDPDLVPAHVHDTVSYLALDPDLVPALPDTVS